MGESENNIILNMKEIKSLNVFIKLSTHFAHDETMYPIYFYDQRSRSWALMLYFVLPLFFLLLFKIKDS